MSPILTPQDQGTWSSRLKLLDRERLRKVVKNVHMRNFPTDKITDYEADRLIDALGPHVGEDLIRDAMRRGLVE